MPSSTSLARSSTSTFVAVKYPQLEPTTPLDSTRYDPVKDPSSRTKHKSLPAGPQGVKGGRDKAIFGLNSVPAGWTRYVHLDGKPYFHQESWKVVTEANILNSNVLDRVRTLYEDLDAELSKAQFKLPDEHEIYLAIDPDTYYIADHATRTVFWVDEVDLEKLDPEFHDKDAPQKSIDLLLERQYYCHIENFPVHNKLPEGAEDFLHSALVHGCLDHITSRDSSTSAWNAADCKTFLELLDESKETQPVATQPGQPQSANNPGHKTWLVARLICNILHSRRLHHYGMHEARTDRLASLEEKRKNKVYGFEDILTTLLLFCAPYTYLARLQNAWADRVISLDDWQELLATLLLEWSDANLLATVTLSSNMAFLALEDMNPVSKTSSIISTLFAIGSMVVGLHHVWRHRVKANTDASHATLYLYNATKTFSSLKTLSFFLSLPLVLLSWSILTFAFSMAVYAFWSVVGHEREWWTFPVIGTILGIIVTTVLFSVLFFTETFSAMGIRARFCQMVRHLCRIKP